MNKTILFVFALFTLPGYSQWKVDTLHPPTRALLIGMDMAADSSLWLSGTHSTLLRSKDFGEHFDDFHFKYNDSLQFRDVHGRNKNSCLVMSAGLGQASQIWLFEIGKGFKKVFQMTHPAGFLDALEFWDDKRGLAYGDAVDGYPFIIITENGGESWHRVPNSVLPESLPGEGGFAASGTCVETASGGRAWIGTGAADTARIFYTDDYGESWQQWSSPIAGGNFSGITSVRNLNDKLYATGGNLGAEGLQENLFYLDLSNKTWHEVKQCPIEGAYYCLAVSDEGALLISGPNGAAVRPAKSKDWQLISSSSLWTCHYLQNKFFFGRKRGAFIAALSLTPLSKTVF